MLPLVYGNLDQTARKLQVQDFRAGLTNILVVTDVAARGIDLPALANVINYDFPSQPKIFVHRVGRTARAGRKGWSYSLIRDSDAPYLIDLQLFLGKRLVHEKTPGKDPNFAEDVIVGSLIQHQLEQSIELVNTLINEDSDLAALEAVANKGESQYIRTRNPASTESVKRAKELLSSRSLSGIHLLFNDENTDKLLEQEKMLQRISSFRPPETVFEIGKRGNTSEAAEIMRRRREQIDRKQQQHELEKSSSETMAVEVTNAIGLQDDDLNVDRPGAYSESEAESEELEISFSNHASKADKSEDFQESEYFMAYTPKNTNLAEDRGYGVHSGSYNQARDESNFVEAARGVTMDISNDEIRGFAEASKARGMRWDKKSKKYVARANDEDGSKGKKMIVGESGLKIAASFRSGRFDDWRKSNKIGRLPRVGESEAPSKHVSHQHGSHRFKHKAERAPKEADRYRDDYHVQKKRVAEAKEKRIGKFKDGGGKSELKGVDDVRKERNIKEQRQKKNARPSKKRKY